MEQTLMGDAEFLTAMVPPSPPSNMYDMVLPANTMDARIYASNAVHPAPVGNNAGIAAAPGRKKGPTASVNLVAPSNGSGKEAKEKEKKGAAVPRLRFAGGAAAAAPAGTNDSDEEEEYEYSIPLSERETALTARDRDLIEQGDWSAIHDELSDNDFSLVGQRVADAHKAVMTSYQKQPAAGVNSNANQGAVSIAPVGSGAVLGAINNPRGGRHFRSPQAAEDNIAAPVRPPPQHHFKNHSGGFQVEDSDEDSTHGVINVGNNNNKNGKKGNNSPRRAVDKLDPIPLPLNDEQGILSGRRYENSAKAVPAARKETSSVSASNAAYAPIYPSLGGAARDRERVDKERDSKYSDWPAHNDDRSRKDVNALKGLAAAQDKPRRRNSRGQLDDDFDLAGLNYDGPSANEPPQLSIGEANAPSAVRSKAGGVGRNGALGRLKAHGPTSGSSSSANINNENSDFSLNVYGAGFGGGNGAGPISAVGPVDSVRPAGKKPIR